MNEDLELYLDHRQGSLPLVITGLVNTRLILMDKH